MAVYGTDGNDNLFGNISRNDPDVFFGLLGNDLLVGYGGDDYLDGGGGNDNLRGGSGINTLVGGLGDDTYIITSSSDIIIEGLNQGIDFVDAFVDYTLPADAEIETFATRATRAIGNDFNNEIFAVNSSGVFLDGSGGNDKIRGWYGIDQLYGGSGNDNLDGMDGNDFLYGGDGNDTLYGVASGPNSVNADTLFGEAGSDSLFGSSGNDTLQGGDGNDLLDGEWLNGTSLSPSSVDILIGGRGSDTYIVDNTGDSVQELTGQGTDTVQSSISLTLSANVENLTLERFSLTQLNGTGNELRNTLRGNSAVNVLNGAGGTDTLIGGEGSDVLTGGTGSDRFVFGSDGLFSLAIPDNITDFRAGIDKIVVIKATFSQLESSPGSGFSVAEEFGVVASDAAAAISTAKVVYNSANGKLFYNPNGSALGLGTFGGNFAVLSGNSALTATDFLIQA